MDDITVLENPRGGKRRTPPRHQSGPKKGQFRKRKSGSRKRRRNPTASKAPAKRRRTSAAPAKRRNPTRRRAAASTPRRRPRRSNPGVGGRIFSVKRGMNIIMDAGGMVGAEFLGDLGARALYEKTPLGGFVADKWMWGVEDARPWFQIALGLFAGPMLRKVRVIPRPIIKYWEVANVASGIIGLTGQMRQKAREAVGLRDWVEVGGGGIAPQLAPTAAGAQVVTAMPEESLEDWETAAINTATIAGIGDGNPFSSY